MDLSILIAALSLLVAALSEIRTAWRNKRKDQIKPIGISLLELIFTLDRIIEVGEQLIAILANIPLREEKVFATLQKKGEILALVERQRKNLETLEEIYNSSLDFINLTVAPSVGNVIEFMIPAKPVELWEPKEDLLRVLEWKTVQGESTLKYLGFAIKHAVRTLATSIEIGERTGTLSLQFPTKIKVGIVRFRSGYEDAKIEGEETALYDLTKQADLRRLLEKAREQLQEIKKFRQSLAQLVLASFSLDDLVKS